MDDHGEWSLLALIPCLFLLASSALVIVSGLLARDVTAQVVSFAVGTVIAFVCLAALFAGTHVRWGAVAALIPCLLITQHASTVANRRPTQTNRSPDARSKAEGDQDKATAQFPALKASVVQAQVRARAEVARRANDLFGPAAVGFHYGVPALLSAVVLSLEFGVLFAPYLPPHAPEPTLNWVSAAQYGAAGAYVYALLHVGQRTLRRDLTGPASAWTVVLLVVGPILAVVVDAIWLGADPRHRAELEPEWSRGAALFLAGLSPRWMLGTIEEAARRLLTRSADVAVASRNVPLTSVRGITSSIAERLEEEAILDARGLAMSDPLRLFRNTSFGKRQILDWIDEALLITALPEGWEGLERIGVSGAVDLAYLTAGPESECDLSVLAGKANVDVVVLRCLSLRLAEDAQVALIWYLYQNDEAQEQGEKPGQPPHTDSKLEDAGKPE